MRNRDFHTRDVKRVCEAKLGIRFRTGSELNGWFHYEGRKVARVTVPNGRKDIPPKTYKSMATQLKLSVEQFDQLLECVLRLQDYSAIIAAHVAATPRR